MQVGEEQEELRLKERVRDLIQTHGKAREVSLKTGIPLGTLNKYVAMRSLPSVPNAAKLAKMAGIPLEELATGFKIVRDDISSTPAIVEDAMSFTVREVVNPHLFERLYVAVEKAHKEAGQPAPAHRLARVTGEVLNHISSRIPSLEDIPVLEETIPIVLAELSTNLREAARAPGYGKRSAS